MVRFKSQITIHFIISFENRSAIETTALKIHFHNTICSYVGNSYIYIRHTHSRYIKKKKNLEAVMFYHTKSSKMEICFHFRL